MRWTRVGSNASRPMTQQQRIRIAGHFSGAITGLATEKRGALHRYHAVDWSGGILRDAVRADGPVAADDAAIHCAAVRSVAVELAGTAQSPTPRWFTADLHDAVLTNVVHRLATDARGSSVTYVEADLQASVLPPRQDDDPPDNFATVPANSGNSPLADATPIGSADPPSPPANAPAPAPPGCGPGCLMLGQGIGCLAMVLALAALIGVLAGWLDWKAVLLGVLVLLAFSAVAWLWSLLRRITWWLRTALGVLGVLVLLGLAASLLAGMFSGGCAPLGVGPWAVLALGVALVAAAPSAIGRGVGILAIVGALFPMWAAQDGCPTTVANQTIERVEEMVTRDAPAEAAVQMSRKAGAVQRLTLDQALSRSWPTGSNCGTPLYLSTDFVFDTDAASIAPRAQPQLRKLAAIIRRTPKAIVIIEGHADSRGDEEHNKQLSLRRAQAVANWLVDQHVVHPSTLKVNGLGAGKPLVTGSDRLSLRSNRRVEVTLDCEGAAP